MTASEPGASRPPTPKGEARRQQILDHAIAMFAERGVDGASLRSLADAIGVSHTALRHYFESRDELLVEVYRAHEAHLGPDAAGGSAAADRDVVSIMATSAERNRSIPGLVRLYATLATDALQEQHPYTRDFIAERFARIRANLATDIEQGQREGRIAADIDPMDGASLVIAASDGLQVQWLLDPDAVDVRRAILLLERLFPSSSH